MVGVFREQTLYPATRASHQPSRPTTWSEDDRKMFSQLRMREEQALLAQDYALETARAEGIEEGLKVGLLNLVRQHLLTAEVASQQLGMTVAEFEALL